MRTLLVSSSCLFVAGAIAACSATGGDNGFQPAGSGAATGPGGTGGEDITLTSGTGTGAGAGILGEEPPCDGVDPGIDNDGDGWTGASGDCNDCTDQMNPGAQDYDGNAIDEDCNGGEDDNPTDCDAALAIDSADGMDGARAMGLCKVAQGESWGVLEAAYVRSDGQSLTGSNLELGRGILTGFGPNVNPQEGAKLLALSSGSARQPTDPDYNSVGGFWKDQSPHGSPPGYPKESPSCPGTVTGSPYDSAGLRLKIRTPSNAKSMSFNLDFYTYEFPYYICDQFNDFFVAMLNPIPQGQPDGNVSFDSQGNTISVNAGFLEVCKPQTAGGKTFACNLGTDQLLGTGYDEQFDGSAATGWLQTSSPIQAPGDEITLHFAIWDSGDGVLDSTVLLDNLVFEVEPADTVTNPVPVPK